MNTFEGILVTAVAGVTLLAAPVTSHGAVGSPLPAGLPHQYAGLTQKGRSAANSYRSNLVIRNTATGRTLATVIAPRPANSFCDLTGTPDGRTFVAESCKVTVTRLFGGFEIGTKSVRYFRLTVDRQGQVGRLRPLRIPVPSIGRQDGSGVSPGGRKLAVASADDRGFNPRNPVIRLYDIGTGRLLRTWKWAGQADIMGRNLNSDPGLDGLPGPMSWTANGTTIAFPLLAGRQQTGQVRLLDTAAPGRNLRRSRLAVNFGPTIAIQFGVALIARDSMITPDGRLIVASTAAVVSGHPDLVRLTVSEFSVATGARVAVLHSVTLAEGGAVVYLPVLWSSPDGRTVIATRGVGPGPRGVSPIGVLTSRGFTPLPGSMARISQIAF